MKQNAKKFGLSLAALMLALLLVGTAVLAPCLVSAEDGAGVTILDPSAIGMEGSGGDEPVAPPFASPGGGDILFEQPPLETGLKNAWWSDLGEGYLCLEDFWELTEDIGDIHWYGISQYSEPWSLGCDPTGMQFEIIFYQRNPDGSPGAPVAVFSNVIPTFTCYDTFGGFPAYRFDVSLGTPVSLNQGWVSIQSTYSPNGCFFAWINSPSGNGNAIQQNGIGNLTDNLAFALTEWGLEFGDAPEGALAYPATGVTGAFPTCINVTIAGWIQHNNFGAWFGPGFDIESDGNAGLCPGFAPYDNDECFQDGDAGLILPQPYTIQGGAVVPCGNSIGTPLGDACQWAQWGSDIDILIHNWMPNHEPYLPGYVNVLVDWNQDGQWQNDPGTTCDANMLPEHVLVDFVIPAKYDGTLSALRPPSFQIGPNDGYAWARFSITEVPVGGNWTGEGAFEDGETEDYLLRVYVPPPVGGEAYPVNKASLLAPWIGLAAASVVGAGLLLRRRRRA